MHDVFISYSRKDSELARQLVERLKAQNVSAWIDRQEVRGAERWHKSITKAIRDSSAFLVLLSRHSLLSQNVVKEVSIANESSVPILPIELEAVDLTDDFIYPLTGLQRVSYENFDSIFDALRNLKIAPMLSLTSTRLNPSVGKKSLMVLPFEDLSPGQDTAWFSDGLSIELISSLSNIKSLRVLDRLTAMSFKGFRGRTAQIARELNVRYFLEGSVRKFGEQVKISVALLDIEEAEYLWTFTQKGTFTDIFEMQEDVAKKVVEGLELQLTHDEVRKLEERGTTNAESYEFYLKAYDYFGKRTREGFSNAIKLLARAIELDPTYAEAYRSKASLLSSLYRSYDRNPEYLSEAEFLAQRASELKPDLWRVDEARSSIYLQQERFDEAEQASLRFIRNAPEDFLSHYSLGFCYMETGKPWQAIAPFKEALRLKPDARVTNWNLVLALDRCGMKDECRQWAIRALDYSDRWCRLHPDDQYAHVNLASLYDYAGMENESHSTVLALEARHDLDGVTLRNIAILYVHFGDHGKAIEILKRAIDAGYSNPDTLRRVPDLAPLRSNPAFLELVTNLEQKIASTPTKNA